MITDRLRIGMAALVMVAAPELAAAGPLQDCCSSKGALCVIPFAGGAAACAAAGGMLFRANACLRTQECGVAHQLPARGRAGVRVQTPQGPKTDDVPLHGAADVIETEMLQLELRGVGPVVGPTSIKKQPMRPAIGTLVPPDSFPAMSFFDVFYEVELPQVGVLRNLQPQRIGAHIDGFPPLEMPYLSGAPVELFDADGQPAGELVELVLEFLPPPDADADGVVDSGDLCPGTGRGVAVNDNGCGVRQLCPCPARHHGQHVRCVVEAAHTFLRAGLITPRQFVGLVLEAALRRCDRPPPPPVRTRTPTATPAATATSSSTSTPTPPDTPTPTPTATPTLATPTAAVIAQLFEGDDFIKAILDNGELIVVPNGASRYLAVRHRDDLPEPGNVHLLELTQLRLLSVNDSRFRIELLAGSDLFAQPGPYPDGAEIELADLPTVATVQGCLAVQYAAAGEITLSCFSDVCGYALMLGDPATPLAAGQQIKVDLSDPSSLVQQEIPQSDTSKYLELLRQTGAGRQDIARCRVPVPPTPIPTPTPSFTPLAPTATPVGTP